MCLWFFVRVPALLMAFFVGRPTPFGKFDITVKGCSSAEELLLNFPSSTPLVRTGNKVKDDPKGLVFAEIPPAPSQDEAEKLVGDAITNRSTPTEFDEFGGKCDVACAVHFSAGTLPGIVPKMSEDARKTECQDETL